MQKIKYFKLIWQYLKKDRFKVYTYILLVVLTFTPSFLSPILWGYAMEALVDGNTTSFIHYLIIWSIIYSTSYTVVQVPKDLLYNCLQIKFTKTVSTEMYHKINNLPSIAFEDIGVGEFINRLYSDTERVMELMSKLIRMICRSCIVVVFLVMSFKISYLIGVEILVFAICMFLISYVFFPKIKSRQEKIKAESDEYVKYITENVSGIREIKSLGIKKRVEMLVSLNLNRLYKHASKVGTLESLYYGFNNLIYFILNFIILYTAGKLYLKGTIALAAFTIVESYIWRIDEIVESISDFGVSFNKISVSLKRIDEIVNNKLYSDEKFGTKELKDTKGIIEFKNVKFKYTEKERYTLNGLDLTIEPHKKIAIVGKSGNGKSTIFNLLLRYFDSTSGNILIDGIDIKDLTEESLRNNISIIRQTPFLFNKSIIDNFRLVRENATVKEIREVCKKAYVDDYIMSLPKKYNTIIGEGGVNLSGGQKQRLAIARTLLINTKVILFDEATSALDNVSQDYIKRTIDELVKDHTVIIVAHRLSTIVDADVIHVISKGRVVGSGTHEELLNNCDDYKSLYTTETLNS